MLKHLAALFVGCTLIVSCTKTNDPITLEKRADIHSHFPDQLAKVTLYDTINGDYYGYRRYEYNHLKQVKSVHTRLYFEPQEANFYIAYDTNGRVDSVILRPYITELNREWKYFYDEKGRLAKTIRYPSSPFEIERMHDTLLFNHEPVINMPWFPKPNFRMHAPDGYRNHFYTYGYHDELTEASEATFETYREVRYVLRNTSITNPEYLFHKASRLHDMVVNSTWDSPLDIFETGSTMFDELQYFMYDEDPVLYRYTLESDNRQRLSKIYYINSRGVKILYKEYQYL
ncbi:hypothetical protein [uncultured Chitinophaga sp.]|uniref:hypothetical protein n=1 Tax=uncultured Chitinophaga sp. TaxID=339340 RepID=UPI0025F7914E|nr:hypothetical protein [uncultured Chitinophaga sp.]